MTPRWTSIIATLQRWKRLSRRSWRTRRSLMTLSSVSSSQAYAKSSPRPVWFGFNWDAVHIYSNLELLESGAKFAEIFGGIFHPLAGEYDLLGKHPEAEKTTRNVDGYSTAMQELRDTLNPELELIATRIIAPAKEFQTSMKTIRKNITKRDHKVCLLLCTWWSANVFCL